jgi:hypothetical protein
VLHLRRFGPRVWGRPNTLPIYLYSIEIIEQPISPLHHGITPTLSSLPRTRNPSHRRCLGCRRRSDLGTSGPPMLSPLACYSLALSAPHMFPRRRIPAPVALDSSAPQPSTPQAASPPNPPCRRSPRTSPRHWRDAQS